MWWRVLVSQVVFTVIHVWDSLNARVSTCKPGSIHLHIPWHHFLHKNKIRKQNKTVIQHDEKWALKIYCNFCFTLNLFWKKNWGNRCHFSNHYTLMVSSTLEISYGTTVLCFAFSFPVKSKSLIYILWPSFLNGPGDFCSLRTRSYRAPNNLIQIWIK